MPTTNTKNRRVVAIVPAAGTGTRMGDSLPKQYLDINGIPMIIHTLSAMAKVVRIERIFVVIAADDAYWDSLLQRYGGSIRHRLSVHRVGGKTRAASVLNGLGAVTAEFAKDDWALVHDAARPCIRTELIEQFLDELEDEAVGGLLALPVADTLKRSSVDQRVETTVDRQALWRAQTPQMFGIEMLFRALAAAPTATDEAQAIEMLGYQPKLVIGESVNLKVTYATDIKLAQILLMEGGVGI
jgi:2-C-methyl-D-erythritol 4-phosphate cytidylyltransferase